MFKLHRVQNWNIFAKDVLHYLEMTRYISNENLFNMTAVKNARKVISFGFHFIEEILCYCNCQEKISKRGGNYLLRHTQAAAFN